MGEKMWPDQGNVNVSKDGSNTEEKQPKKESVLEKMYNDLFPDVMAPSGPRLTIKTPDNPDLRFSRPKPEPKPARDLRFRPEPPKTSGPPIRDLWPPKK